MNGESPLNCHAARSGVVFGLNHSVMSTRSGRLLGVKKVRLVRPGCNPSGSLRESGGRSPTRTSSEDREHRDRAIRICELPRGPIDVIC